MMLFFIFSLTFPMLYFNLTDVQECASIIIVMKKIVMKKTSVTKKDAIKGEGVMEAMKAKKATKVLKKKVLG